MPGGVDVAVVATSPEGVEERAAVHVGVWPWYVDAAVLERGGTFSVVGTSVRGRGCHSSFSAD